MTSNRPNTFVRALRVLCFIALIQFALNSAAQAANITTHQDASGWKLKVDGRDFYIKGVVWGYTPKDENYSYNLWAEKDQFIKQVLDHDFGLMKKAGVNAVRSFATIPPKWVTYIYQQHGIMTVMNPLVGRYGATINGAWRERTDYSDPATRAVLKKEVLDVVKKYRSVPGILMFALGNENNYGLSWSSFEIENLPVGERNQKKAEYLYSLYGEIIDEARQLAPNYPYTIVNGDIQYIDLIAKYGKNWDLLGVNAYRGISFTGLWRDVKAKYGKPVLFFEFGSDAFNQKSFAEDEAAQAEYLKGQWQEMYQKSYGNGQEGNSIGGFVFQWRDEWWKYKQTENLDKQDRNASWSNGGYQFDFVHGQNNMNEEWFGITRLGDITPEGFYTAEPRMAYYVLADIWRIDPYQGGAATMNKALGKIDLEEKKQGLAIKPKSSIRVADSRVRYEIMGKGLGEEYHQQGRDAVDVQTGAMAFTNIDFEPSSKLRGSVGLNLTLGAPDSDFEFRYGDRLFDEEGSDANEFEIYSFNATLEDDDYNIHAFYHVPRYHWGDKGDFFGLMRETTDMEGQDIWNAKAPAGIELEGKGDLDGLNVVMGPEVYWGANPKVIAKYQFGKDKQYSILHSEDFSRADSPSGTSATSPETRQTTLQAKLDLGAGTELQIGGIIGNTNKVHELYDRLEGDVVIREEIDYKDTLGVKARLDFDTPGNGRAYIAGQYAGLVADGGEPRKEFGTQLPYSGRGNKKVLEAGWRVTQGDFMIFPRVFYRENLEGPNPTILPTTNNVTVNPGIDPRNTDTDPFAVLDNRAAKAAEIFLTYDPTPGTHFYDWDNDVREDAKFAFNVGLTATEYKTATDAHVFYYEEGGHNAAFDAGLPAEDVWLAKSKMVFNPKPGVKAIAKLEGGKQQPAGQPEEAIKYFGIEGKLILDKQNIFTAKYKKDGWGPYDFQREFNVTYPEQYELGYERLLNKGLKENKSSKVGIKAFYRSLDENSDSEFYQNGANRDMFEVRTYLDVRF